MKFTLSWLKEHLDTTADATTVADTLTRIGLEVESVDNPAAALKPFVIARVLTDERHPQADKLQVLSVDIGHGAPLQVVCGAPNARAGMIGVFGGPGTYVPGSDFTLKLASIRGVESNGMMCSARELQLSDEHEGIIELDVDAPVGTSFADFAGLDDSLFDVAITPNRQDCMGVRGIARDLAAAGLGKLRPLAEVYRQPTIAHIGWGSFALDRRNGRLAIHLGQWPQCPQSRRRQVARNPAHAHAILPVGGDRDVEQTIVQPREIGEARPHRRIGVEFDDSLMLVAQLQFARRAHHAIRFDPADRRQLEREIAPRNISPGPAEHTDHPGARIGRPAHHLQRFAMAGIDR